MNVYFHLQETILSFHILLHNYYIFYYITIAIIKVRDRREQQKKLGDLYHKIQEIKREI